jgi:MFS family permease
MGTFSGRATDAGFFKLTFVIGSVIQLCGIFLISWCKTYWQVLLAQGVCVGIGNGLVFVPSVALASTYFFKNRAVALGLCASGSATGGLVFPAIAQQLLPKVGFPWTIRVMGFVMMVGMIAAATLMKPRLPPRKSGPLIEWAAFAELPFFFFCLSAFFLFWGVYVGFYYVGSFAREILHTSQTTNIDLLLTMNGVGVPARIIPAYFSDRTFGPLNSILPFAAIAGVVLFSWAAVDTVTGVWIFAVVYGALAAGVQGLFPAVLTSLTSEPRKQGVRTGMGFGVAGFACLSGPPIAGALIGVKEGSYLYTQVFAGSSMVAAFVMLNICRYTQVGFKLKEKI